MRRTPELAPACVREAAEPAPACRVLIVEDDADSREPMQKALRLFGYDADCAGTYLEGVAKLNADTRWLVLDLHLPDGDGAALLRHVRERALPIHVAVVTGSADDSQLTQAVLFKPDALFTKPVDVADVAIWLASRDSHDPPAEVLPGTYPPA